MKKNPLISQNLILLPKKPVCNLPDITISNYDVDSPETIIDNAQEPCAVTSVEYVPISTFVSGTPSDSLVKSNTMKVKPADPVEKTLRVEGDVGMENEEGDTLECEESSKVMPGVGRPITPKGPGSFRSVSGKNDQGRASAGSSSQLSGLGRSAKCQLAVVLDEFRGKLYDLHGQITQ